MYKFAFQLSERLCGMQFIMLTPKREYVDSVQQLFN